MFRATILLLTLLTGCLQQTVPPVPDKNTRGCLIREQSNYSSEGGNWSANTLLFDYNTDGNPTRLTVLNEKRVAIQTFTFTYDGPRLKKANYYTGSEDTTKLEAYKTFAVNADFTVIIAKTFWRRASGVYALESTLAFDFFRNKLGVLKLNKMERVGEDAQPEAIGKRSGLYSRIEYDEDQRNVSRQLYTTEPNGSEQLQVYFAGYDTNGRSPWNANFWLSLTNGYQNDFHGPIGFWSESNLTLFRPGSFDRTPFFVQYKLNSEGFPCVSTYKLADNSVLPAEGRFYYYNCGCSN